MKIINPKNSINFWSRKSIKDFLTFQIYKLKYKFP